MKGKGCGVSAIRADQSFQGVFNVRNCVSNTSRFGRAYLKMVVEDHSGKIDAYYWEPVVMSVKSNAPVWISAKGRAFGSRIICDVISMIEVSRQDICPLLLAPHNVPLPDESAKVSLLLSEIRKSNFGMVVNAMISDEKFLDGLLQAPASLRHHHAYPGGLIRHTRETMEIVLANSEGLGVIERDLLLTAAFLHDLGKVHEYRTSCRLTDRGEMVGHEITLLEMLTPIMDRVWEMNHPHRIALLHLLVAKPAPQWTGIRHPRTALSKILSFADNLSADMDMKLATAGSRRFMAMVTDPQPRQHKPLVNGIQYSNSDCVVHRK